MFRGLICALVMSVSFGAWAQDAAGFHKRFQLVKSADGKVLAIRLKVFSHFSLRPFVEQVKNDLLSEQRRWNNKSAQEMEARIDAELVAMGLDPYAKDGEENAGAIKDSLMNIPNNKVEESFAELRRTGLLAEFEARLGGATYEEIALAGGGIRSSVAATCSVHPSPSRSHKAASRGRRRPTARPCAPSAR
jgi:hypothetical protein